MRYFIKYEPVVNGEAGLVKTDVSRTLYLDPSYADKVELSHNDFLNMNLEISKETFRRVVYNASKYNKALALIVKDLLGFQDVNQVTGKLIYTTYSVKDGNLVIQNPLYNWNGELSDRPMEFVNVVYNERFDDNFTAEQLNGADFVLIKTELSFGYSIYRAFPVIDNRVNKSGMHDGIWLKIINHTFEDDFNQPVDMIRTMTRFE